MMSRWQCSTPRTSGRRSTATLPSPALRSLRGRSVAGRGGPQLCGCCRPGRAGAGRRSKRGAVTMSSANSLTCLAFWVNAEGRRRRPRPARPAGPAFPGGTSHRRSGRQVAAASARPEPQLGVSTSSAPSAQTAATPGYAEPASAWRPNCHSLAWSPGVGKCATWQWRPL